MVKLVYKRIILFLNKHKILYKSQFGFRHNHSTSMALIEIVDNILEDLEKGKYIAGIYIDFSKAFHTVDHQFKLENYGFRGQILIWLTSYLHNRQQYTVVNGKNSSPKCINY